MDDYLAAKRLLIARRAYDLVKYVTQNTPAHALDTATFEETWEASLASMPDLATWPAASPQE